MLECLNECSGLFSLLAVVASIIVPFWIYRKQKKTLKQNLKDELEMLKSPRNPLAMNKELRERDEKIELLEKKLRRM